MNVNIGTISFDESELETIAITDLRPRSLALSHLFLKLGGRYFLMLKAGSLVTEDFILKYKKKGVSSFFSLPIGEPEDKKKFLELFDSLDPSKTLGGLLKIRDEILKTFADMYWRHSSKSLLSFSAAAFESFYDLSQEVVERTNEISVELHSKNLVGSALAVMTTISLSITDRQFIRDIYNTVHLLDISLVTDPLFNSHLLIACEKERLAANAGRDYLKKMERPQSELKLFFEHPVRSYEMAKKHKDRFAYPEVLEFIKLHHELEYGGGFPNSLSGSSIAETERILTFVDRLVPFLNGELGGKKREYRVRDLYEDLLKSSDFDEYGIEDVASSWLSSMEWTTGLSEGEKKEGEKVA